MKLRKYCFYLALLLMPISCLEVYNPPGSNVDRRFLVVNGSVDTADSSATIILSRTQPLASNDSTFEPNATVTIEDTDGGVYPLTETGNGVYALAGVNFILTKKYFLHIITSDNTEYLSEPVDFLPTPPIDSVTWAANYNGVVGTQMNVNTHDSTGNSKFFKWDYVETWEYESYYYSNFELKNGIPSVRPPQDAISKCWKSVTSTRIIIGTTLELNKDVVSNSPIVLVPAGSTKIARTYSLLVHQRSISEDEFKFWQQLQKTTEGLGGIFSAQPSQVTGNIYNKNNRSEPVLGYFGGGTTSQKRMFVSFRDLPKGLQIYNQPYDCWKAIIDASELYRYGDNQIVLISGIGSPEPVAYYYSQNVCTDCRVLGGSTTKPSFWP